MANPQDRPYSQEHQQSKQHECTRDDFAAYASANANYYYQMSLWWWNSYMHNLHARTQPWASQFADQSCECVQRSMMVEDDCECCQNDGGFESQGGEMNLCKDCPDSQFCTGPPWHRLQGEYSASSENQHDFNFKGNHDLDDEDDNDNNIGSGSKFEDCNGRSDDDDCYDDDNDDDDDDDDSSDVNMEVDDNFRKFLEQSEKHRQEREQSELSVIKVSRNSFFFFFGPNLTFEIKQTDFLIFSWQCTIV